jgi:CRP-like cAMP-binding protein
MPPRVADLRTIPLFRGFSEDELGEVSTLFLPVESQAPLFEVGQPAREFYLLTAGQVTLDRPGDDVYQLSPPALIGELGALTGLPRSSKATPGDGAQIWRVEARTVQSFLGDYQDLGLRFMANLLEIVADKIHRDQRRMADMRGNLVRTQKELKRLTDLVLQTVETPLSAPVHDSLQKLIATNRRVNYRVAPPAALAATLRVEQGAAPIIELSRTHLSARWPVPPPTVGTWITAVLDLAGAQVVLSGKIMRTLERRVTIELDVMIEDNTRALEGYLTRVQLLDIMV